MRKMAMWMRRRTRSMTSMTTMIMMIMMGTRWKMMPRRRRMLFNETDDGCPHALPTHTHTSRETHAHSKTEMGVGRGQGAFRNSLPQCIRLIDKTRQDKSHQQAQPQSHGGTRVVSW